MTTLKSALALCFLLAAHVVTAQGVQDARKMIYYERYQGAKDVLKQILTADPANAEAAYWLTQAEFGLHDPSAALPVLRASMQGANGSNPLLLSAMGQAELSTGKTNDARQRFETAISLSGGKDVAVLNAVGKANLVDGGDFPYAVEKLKSAVALLDAQKKGPKDPDVYINLGDAYRKVNDGGNAVKSYESALLIDPKLAVAKYRIAKVYLTQGNDQKDIFLRNFEEAVALDPQYAPAYYDLYTYYFTRDVYKATNYFNQYKANADKGPAIDYEEASLLYASGDFNGAIQKATQLINSQGAQADARLYRLQAYSYDKKKDSVNTVERLEKFFSVARPDQIVSDNYVVMAMNAAKFPERQSQVDEYFSKAVSADTSLKNKIDYTRKAADFFKRSKNQQKTMDWYMRVLTVNPTPGKADLYNAGFESYRSGAYTRADSIFKVYSGRYPDEVYGYLWSYRSLAIIDSTMEQGLALTDCQKLIEVAEKDKAKNKNILIPAYGYLAGYVANMKKDYQGAIGYLDKILEIDPTNADATRNKDILLKAVNKAGAAKPAGTPPPPAPKTP